VTMDSFLKRWRDGLALALLAILSVGCGAVRNPALERARDSYQQARHDPEVVGRASVALNEAAKVLDRAERLWTDAATGPLPATKREIEEVEHLSYLAEKRIEIARAIARRRLAADEIRQLKSQRE
jgi:OmpA-OmpF porin, OOP family